ncbi:MAG: tripartite tricarboxylate transporter TctB family protein [Burkholderiales bacterium]
MLTDRVIFACTVIVAVIYLYATTQIPVLAIGDPLGPKAFPRLLGIALLIAAAFLGLELWRGREPKAEESERPAEPAFERGVIAVLLVIVLWTGCYYLVFEWLGYVLATTLYLLPMMMWFNRRRWIANILSAVVFVALTYFLFVKLEVRLPPGVLPL